MERIASFNEQIIKNDCFLPDLFSAVTLAPPDAILGTALAYKAD